MSKTKFKCEVCSRDSDGVRCIAFIPNEENQFGHALGKNYLLCMECYLSYLSQHFVMTNREIGDHLKWSSSFFDKARA